jgi:hypothetical protein
MQEGRKMDERCDVWIIHSEKKVQVTDFPGPPTAICFVTPEAKTQMVAEGRGPTIGELMFRRDDHRPFKSYDEATEYGKLKAEELGYDLDVYWSFIDTGIDEDYDWSYDWD